MLLQKAIIFRNRRLRKNFVFKSKYPLNEYFLDFEIGTEKFLINAIHIKAQNSKGFVYFLHGTLRHIQYHINKAEFFIENNFDVILIDYPKYGKSKGKLTEPFLHQIVEMSYKKMVEILQFKTKPILYGRSLGTALASNLATKIDADILVLVSPYYNMPDLFHQKISLFPFKKLKFKFENQIYLPQVQCDTYIFHGNKDKLIPMHLSERLIPFLKRLENYIEVKDANHFNIHNHPTYLEKLKELLQNIK